MEDTHVDKLSPTDYRKHRRDLVVTFVFWIIGFLTIPNLLLLPSSGLDISWILGLNMAETYGYQFGKDIIFTLGPLAFLYLPVYCQFNTWFISAVFSLFVHFLLIHLIVIMMKKLSLHPLDYVLMGIVLMVALPVTYIEYKLLFSVLMLLYPAVTDQSNPKRMLMLCVFVSSLMAVASLIKFTTMLISFSILLFMSVFYLYKKRFGNLCCMLFTYIVSILVLLVVTGQKVTNFPTYLLVSYEVSKGYNTAMYLSGPGRDVCLGFCVIGLLVFLLLESILKNKSNLMWFILLSSGFVFISFKHGLIRHDGHVYIFFANVLLVFCSMYMVYKKQFTLLSCRLSLTLICVLVAFIVEGYPHLVIPNALGKLKTVYSAASLATDNAAGKARILENAKSKMKQAYSLNNETLKHIADTPVDILPWEISMAFAHDLNWSPRPVFQCYSGYTHKLDMINSQYFESADAPKFLLYAFGTIDGRYPPFDTPATFRTILRNYEPEFIDHGFIFLRKTDTRYFLPPKTISAIDTELGKSVSAPKTKNGYLYAKIYMEYNLLGKIANLVYKSPGVNIKLTGDNGTFEHRFIFSPAQNGIFLSQYIDNVEDLFNVWDGKLNNNLDTFIISAENRYFYDKYIRVEFFEVPQKP
jgi:hypothetical protein